MKLRTHLFRLVLLAILPVVLFCAAIVYYLHRQQLNAQHETLVNAAHGLSLAVDRELTAAIRALQVLATSEYLARGDIESFYAQANRTLAAHGAWQAVVLSDRNGNMVANTRLPFRSPLPQSGSSGMVGKVLQTGRPAVSNLTIGAVGKSPIVRVGVPVVRAGAVRYVISAVTSPGFLADLLADEQLPTGWIVAIIDQDGKIIVRTDKPGRFEGWPAPPQLLQKIRVLPRGTIQDVTTEGIAVDRGYQRSSFSGWTVAVALPVAEFAKPLRAARFYTIGAGIGLLAFGLILAHLAARRIAIPMTDLANGARAIARGESALATGALLDVTEIHTVADALTHAAANRARMEQELRNALEFNRQAIEAIPGGAWAIDRDLRYTLWSESRARVTGVAANDALGKRVGELFLASAEAVRERIRQALDGQTVVAPDHVMASRYTEGSPRWVSTTLNPLRNAAGEIIGVLGVNTDVTERKQAEAELAESEARFRAMFDQAGVGVAQINATSGKIERANYKYCQITGYSEDELRGLDFMSITHTDDIAPGLAGFEQLQSGGRHEFSREKRLLRKDGAVVWIKVTVAPMWAMGNAPTTNIAVIEDITARKAAEENLAAAEKRFRAAIEHSTDCLTLYDRDGFVIYVSPSIEPLTGRKPDEILGTRFGSRRHPDDQARALAAFGAVLANPATPQTIEFRVQHRDGNWGWIEATLSNHLDDPNIRAVVSNRRDITARKQAEEELASTERRFRAMIEHGADGIALLDPESKVVYMSPSAARITGRSPEARVGSNTTDFHHPEDQSILPNAIAALLRDPQSIQRVEFRTRHQDGSWRWIEAALTNRLDDPAIRAIVSNYRDISARKLAQAAAQATSSLMESTLNSLPLEVAVIDGDGVILSVNRAWLDFAMAHGADMERVGPGSNYLQACAGGLEEANGDGKLIGTGLSAVMSGHLEQFQYEYFCQTSTGSRYFTCYAAPVRNHPSARMVLAHEDITARKEADQELTRAADELQQLCNAARSLHRNDDLQAMGEGILNQAIRLSGADLGVIRLRETPESAIRVIARYGYRDPQNLRRHTRSSASPSSAGVTRPRDRMRTFELSQTHVVERIEPGERMATFHREGICSLISIPVLLGDTPHCVMQLGYRTARRFEPRLVRLLEALAHDFGIAAQKTRLLEQTLANQARLRELSNRLVDAQESERRYIARELHDEIGALLSALKIMIKLDGGETAQSLSVVDEALAKTRAIAQHLRPPMLDALGLAATIDWYAKEFTARTRISVDIHKDGIDRRFGGDLEIAAFRIFQEALTNVARHAQASSVVAQFSACANLLRVAILDNGVGFDTTKALQRPSSSGLSGMRERVAALGGRIEISRDPNGGTAVDVEIPLQSQNIDLNHQRSETLP